MQAGKTVYILSEVGQVHALQECFAHEPGLVVALSPLVEEELERRGIPYHSGRTHYPKDTKRFLAADAWVSAWVASGDWQWFSYRNVALTHLFSFSAQLYMVSLLYYTHILESIVATHGPKRLVIFPSEAMNAPARRALERKQANALIACAHLVGSLSGIVVEVSKVARTPVYAMRIRVVSGILTQIAIECGIRINNFLMGLRPRKDVRILASDYWRNIEPIASALPSGDLILFDRSEIMHARLMDVWRLGVRLLNFDSFRSKTRVRQHDEVRHAFVTHWNTVRANIPAYGTNQTSLVPLLSEMLEELVTEETPRMLPKIDSAWRMLEKLRPNVVFLRVSVTSQPHFYILASVARLLGIASLELQHGLEYLGPGSISKRHGAEYVAVYGQVIQDEFAALGFPREKFPIVGSPRFDAYSTSTLPTLPTSEEFTILCVGYGVGMEWFYDDYETEEYYTALAHAVQNIPNVRVIVKLRPGVFREVDCRALVRRAFGSVPYTIVQHEPFPELFARVHVVYSYYSTVILEALQFGKPVVAYSAQEMERIQITTHFASYAARGALVLADTPSAIETSLSALRDSKMQANISAQAHATMKDFHLFDGRASVRIIEFIQRLARKDVK